MLSRERATLTVAQFDALLALLAQHSGRSDLGFEMGLAVKLEDHPALGVALRRCATADSLLRLLVRFSRLITPSFNLSYQRSVRQGEFIWRPAAPMSAATLHAVQEGVAVSLHTEIKAMLGERLRPCDIYLSMPAPPHRSRYRRLRPTRYHFSSQTLPEVRLVIGAELLDLPLTQPHLHADPVAESELEAQQRGIGRSARWSEWVSMMLREAEGCQPTRAQLAELLDVSEPTLVRYLAKEGHCLRDLGNRIRRERACALLRGSRQSITEIAYRLGYSDVANFSHAFRAASDLSPRAWRSMQTAEDSLDPQIVRGTNAPAPRKRKF
jgi:AraC-like DNA-binding protein